MIPELKIDSRLLKPGRWLFFCLVVLIASTSATQSIESNCRTFFKKYRVPETESLYSCKFSRRSYRCTNETDPGDYIAEYFSSTEEMLKYHPPQRHYSSRATFSKSQLFVFYDFDSQNRMTKEISSLFQAYYTKWDSLGRNLHGSASISGRCRNLQVDLEYDDRLLQATIRFSGGQEIMSQNDTCERFSRLKYVRSYDKHGNLISEKIYENLIERKAFTIESIENHTICR